MFKEMISLALWITLSLKKIRICSNFSFVKFASYSPLYAEGSKPISQGTPPRPCFFRTMFCGNLPVLVR